MKIVWIPLDQEKDDPQAIFESLNDKGMPLRASELLCSYLFRPIIEAKEPYEELHNDQWLAAIRILDSDDRFEEYLRNLFSIGETKMVGKYRKIYIHFKVKNPHLAPSAAKQQLADISSSAPLYRTIVDPHEHPHRDGDINGLLIAVSNTRMEASTPFVLSVLRANAAGKIDDNVARAILRETLVLLVRRKMTMQPTTQYDVMFPQLLTKIVNETNRVQALQDQFKKYDVWVGDKEFEEALIHKPTYRRNDLSFSRMILTEIDKSLESFGQLPDYTTVSTIEHTLPQTPDEGWKKYLGGDAEDEHLSTLTDSLGNLCLLSGSANSSAGRDPFEAKCAGYSSVTALACQIKEYAGPWNLEAIRQRSKKLAIKALEIWPWSKV